MTVKIIIPHIYYCYKLFYFLSINYYVSKNSVPVKCAGHNLKYSNLCRVCNCWLHQNVLLRSAINVINWKIYLKMK